MQGVCFYAKIAVVFIPNNMSSMTCISIFITKLPSWLIDFNYSGFKVHKKLNSWYDCPIGCGTAILAIGSFLKEKPDKVSFINLDHLT